MLNASKFTLPTMLAAVAERRQEIGLFRALGFRQQHVMRVILGEATAVSLGSGLMGWLGGVTLATFLAPRLADLTAPVSWDPWFGLGAIGGAVVIGLLGSLYPAIHAAQLDPTTALHAL